jgi:phosphopantetheine--protein transferase-like protein
MSVQTQLRSLVAELFHAAPDTIGPDFPLRHPRLQGSAGRGVLAATIKRRLGTYVAASFSAQTYGELELAVCGVTTPSPEPSGPAPQQGVGAAPPASVASPAANLSVGVDIEMVENLPEVGDFWTADFYRTHFTSAEIAYCLRHEQPRIHFAARWCAKEALAKCDSQFMGVDPTTLQVALAADGRPVFERIRGEETERLPYAVSLTHTAVLAAAIVAFAPPAPAA